MAEQQRWTWSRVRQAIADTVLLVAGIFCLVAGGVFLVQNEATSAGTGLTAGLVLLLASTVDRFEVLKGLGMEARTRKMDEAITRATATLEQLRELAEMSGATVISLNSKAGRVGGAPSAFDSYQTIQRVRKNLISVGSTPSVVREVMAPWVRITTYDLVESLLKDIRHPYQLLLQSWTDQIQSYPQPIMAGDSKFQHLIDERNRLGRFEADVVGEHYKWIPGTHAERLRSIVESIPLLDESDRPRLRNLISPWLPRLDYLAVNYDLSDSQEWFDKLKR